MQSPNNDGKQQPILEPGSQQDAELSEAWRALLGSRPSTASVPAPESQIDPAAPVQPLNSDPWNLLLHVKGMEAVDLQKIHLHTRDSAANDADVEHALDIMQEATGQAAPQNEKA